MNIGIVSISVIANDSHHIHMINGVVYCILLVPIGPLYKVINLLLPIGPYNAQYVDQIKSIKYVDDCWASF